MNKAIIWLAAIFSIAFQLGVLLLVGMKASRTTHVDIFWHIPLFAIFCFAGIMMCFVWDGYESKRRAASTLIVAGGFGAVLPLYLHFTGTQVYYERWIKDGMGPLSDNPEPYLIDFGIALVLAVAGICFIESRVPGKRI